MLCVYTQYSTHPYGVLHTLAHTPARVGEGGKNVNNTAVACIVLIIAAPAKREREWLENKKVLESIPHGVRLRVERYPDAAMLRSILND